MKSNLKTLFDLHNAKTKKYQTNIYVEHSIQELRLCFQPLPSLGVTTGNLGNHGRIQPKVTRYTEPPAAQ